jgi:hypothetical protein
MAVHLHAIERLIPKASGLLKKLKFSGVDLENRHAGVGSRHKHKIADPESAHEQHAEKNEPEPAAQEVKDVPELKPA